MIVCVNHPNREATMDVTDDFCDLCWTMWFTEDWHKHMPKRQLMKERRQSLNDIWAKYKESPTGKEQEEQLEEMLQLTEQEYVVL